MLSLAGSLTATVGSVCPGSRLRLEWRSGGTLARLRVECKVIHRGNSCPQTAERPGLDKKHRPL